MRPILMRLSNVVAWLNFALGPCASLGLLYFALLYLINGDNRPLSYDFNNQEIVLKLGSAGVHDQSNMPLRELADIRALMELPLEKDEKERLTAKANLPDCFAEYPLMNEPSFNPYKGLMQGDNTILNCWRDLQKSNSSPLAFDFTPDQALVAWNDIAMYKKEQEVRNRKRSTQVDAGEGIVVSLLFASLYIFLATLNYIFSGSFRFIPWVSFGK